jgi:hypothetical protein
MTPDPSKTAKIIDKIEKMLRLANNAGTEAEAAAAANMAQEMLAAYNLSMADVDITSDQKKPRPGDERVKEKTKKVALYAWQKTLWEAIAQSNFCWYRRVPEMHTNKAGNYVPKTFHHYIIGGEANVVTTRMMGEYLEQAISRLCPYKPGRDSSRSWNSWKEGCAARLAERLQEKLMEMVRETRAKAEEAAKGNTCTAISLVDVMQREEDLNYRAEYGEEAYQSRICYRNHDPENNPIPNCATCSRRAAFAVQSKERLATIGAAQIEEKRETETQRRKREERERRQWQRYQAREEARNRQYWNKRDVGAFKQGAEAGKTIGLDPQVSAGRETKRLGGG